MRKRRSEYLTDYFTSQHDLETYKKMIFIVLDIVEFFIIKLDDSSYSIKLIPNNYVKLGGFQKNVSSKIESLVISKYDDNEKIKKFMAKYYSVLNSLERKEYLIFESCFINRLDNISTMMKLNLNSTQLNTIKKSAIVRFCTRLGLNKFTYIFEKDK